MPKVSTFFVFCFLLLCSLPALAQTTTTATRIAEVAQRLPDLSSSILLGQFDLALKLDRREPEVTETFRLRIAVLRTAYEERVTDGCNAGSLGSLSVLQIRQDTVTRQFGQVVDRQMGEVVELRYRTQYKASFLRSMDSMMNPFGVLSNFGLSFGRIFADVAGEAATTHATLGCDTPEAAVFAANLDAIVLGAPSVQARGQVERLLQPQCRESIGDLTMQTAEACVCIGAAMLKQSPVGFVSHLENGFSRERFILSFGIAPDLFEEVKACL